MRLRKPGEANIRDSAGFFEELNSESPRAAAILAAAFLDGWLRHILEAAFVSDVSAVNRLLGDVDGGDQPLSSFSSRIDAAYALGLIANHLAA